MNPGSPTQVLAGRGSETRAPLSRPIKAASHSRTNDAVFDLITGWYQSDSTVLDFGAGHGHLCQRLGEFGKARGRSPREWIVACETAPDEFRYEEVECRQIEPDSCIPFPDASFDAVVAIEVLEHTSRPYDFFIEAARVLRPGGHLVFSTPNFLSIRSRISLLLTGFAEMALPPSIDPKNAGRLCGHIMPLGYPYYVYGLRHAGFDEIQLHVDRLKRSAVALAVLAWPVLRWANSRHKDRVRRYGASVYEENQEVLERMNSMTVLAARSCLLSAHRPQ